MERGIWNTMMTSLRRVRPRSPVRAAYTNRDVLAVLLFAALHDRPISWACRRSNWPAQAWRRRLPDQSTMSRRLRDPALLDDLRTLIAHVQRDAPSAPVLAVDGKALALRAHTRDPDAANGWGSGSYARGYKLHAIADTAHKLLAFDVHPMNKAECTTARALVDRLPKGKSVMLLGDAAYDSNPLHAACASRGLALLAPRRRPDRPLCTNRRHEPSRLVSIDLLESPSPPDIFKKRTSIERFFSRLAIAAGLYALPPWVRRLHRVRAWVAAKLAINAAIIWRRNEFDA